MISDDQFLQEHYQSICNRVKVTGDRGNHPSDFETLSPQEQEALRYWIRHALQRASRFGRRSSYGLKHDFEREAFYISNGQFKGAMLLEGYEPQNVYELNWVFRIKPRIRRASSDYDTFSRSDLERYSLGCFDKQFAQLLIEAGYLTV